MTCQAAAGSQFVMQKAIQAWHYKNDADIMGYQLDESMNDVQITCKYRCWPWGARAVNDHSSLAMMSLPFKCVYSYYVAAYPLYQVTEVVAASDHPVSRQTQMNYYLTRHQQTSRYGKRVLARRDIGADDVFSYLFSVVVMST